MKFKVGDKVVANKLSNERYGITNKANNWEGKVTKVYENYFSAKKLESGKEFDLEYKYFDKLEEEGDIMKKSDLKSGAIVEIRRGNKYMLLLDTKNRYCKNCLISLGNGGYLNFDEYNDDLKDRDDSEYDIVKICQYDYVGDNICSHILKQAENDWTWNREEETVMTISEIEEKLGISNLKIKKED